MRIMAQREKQRKLRQEELSQVQSMQRHREEAAKAEALLYSQQINQQLQDERLKSQANAEAKRRRLIEMNAQNIAERAKAFEQQRQSESALNESVLMQ